jgi:hypothetical protein
MPCIPRIDALDTKAKSAAIAMASWLAIDGLTNREYARLVHPKYATLVVGYTGLVAYCAQDGIIKGFGFFEVIGT